MDKSLEENIDTKKEKMNNKPRKLLLRNFNYLRKERERRSCLIKDDFKRQAVIIIRSI
jgi:hypothetical protein